MREWREIGNFLILDMPSVLLVRCHIFNKDGETFTGGDIILEPADICDLYALLKEKIIKEINEKSCGMCVHFRGRICWHPDGARGEDECRRENKKYFEPRVQI